MSKPLKGFIAYSHVNCVAKETLRTYLDVMRQQNKLVTWHDGDITAGDRASQENILKEVADSGILLYLVSAASLASDNCNKELAKALKENLRIIPIILEACDWENHQLSNFEVLPYKGKAINKWEPESDGWDNVVKGIREAVDKMLSQARPSPRIMQEDIEVLADLALQKGNFVMMLGQMDSAVAAYSRAIELKPNYAKAYYNRGVAYQNQGEINNAIRDYTKAIALKPEYVSAYKNRGVAHRDLDNYTHAIEDCKTAIMLNPGHADAYTNLGTVYRRIGDIDSAIALYDKAIRLSPNDSDIYYNRGLAYDGIGSFDRAIADYDSAIDLKPDFFEAYNNRGAVYRKNGDYDHAIEDYDAAIAINSAYAMAYCNRGLAYRDRSEFDRAITDLTKGIKLGPNLASAYYHRGMVRIRMMGWEKAKSDLMIATDKGSDIIASFRNEYESVEDFEQRNNMKLPEDIAEMLTPQALSIREDAEWEATH